MVNNYFSSIFIFLILLPEILNSTIEEFRNSFKEVAYSYYMRGKSIQWCVARDHFFSPEESTEQNANYIVTTSFTSIVYEELLNVVVPYSPSSLLKYANDYNGKPEVAGNTYKISDDIMEMRFYISPDETKVIENPSLNDIFPFLQVGDILVNPSYAFLVYDFEKDKNGNITDVIIIQSVYGYHNNSYINTKLPRASASKNNNDYPSTLYLFNGKLNSDFEEGTIKMGKLSEQFAWANIKTKYKSSQYAILRYVQGDSEKNAVLKYENIYDYYIYGNYSYNSKINLSANTLDRSKKFNHLYISKTVDEMNNAVVELGDILNYRIVIRNSGDKDYNEDIIVTEIISQYVEYQDHSENRQIISFQQDSQNNKLIWNIGKLHKGDEYIITYKVKVIKGKTNDVIVSTGFVGNIRSSSVNNFIGRNLKESQKNLIKKNYENLKKSYNGRNLINEIYKQSFEIDINLNKFNMTNLILDKKKESREQSSISLNISDSYYNGVLSNYWSSLATMKYQYPGNEEEVDVYFIKEFEYFYNMQTYHKRRKDYIYPQHFKTGDILIYKNSNDSTYLLQNNKAVKLNITYEDGEYYFIYIEGKGFVGVNYGNDGIPNTEDDRNDFTAKYYKDNNLVLLNNVENPSDEILELANLQTLLTKDYYVILRPSLLYNFPYTPESKSYGLMIFLIILFIIILAIVIFILWKYCNMRKKGIEFNFTNLKQELLPS